MGVAPHTLLKRGFILNALNAVRCMMVVVVVVVGFTISILALFKSSCREYPPRRT
jgi:hypothetical protein